MVLIEVYLVHAWSTFLLIDNQVPNRFIHESFMRYFEIVVVVIVEAR